MTDAHEHDHRTARGRREGRCTRSGRSHVYRGNDPGGEATFRPLPRDRGALRQDRGERMRLPNSAHGSRRWRIAEIAPDFRLEDVWALPARGGAEDFDALLAVVASLDPAHGASAATRLLFWIRYRVGGWFRWDDASRARAIPSEAEATLSARLPGDLRSTATSLDRSPSGFRPLLSYRPRVGRRTLEPDRSRRDAPRLGGQRRGRLSRADVRVRQASRQARGRLHGTDQAISTSSRLPSPDEADRASLEHESRPRRARRVITNQIGAGVCLVASLVGGDMTDGSSAGAHANR